MNHGFVNDSATLEMLHDNALQQQGGDVAVPHAFRVHDDDRPAAAHAEAGRLAALDAGGAEQQSFALEERRQQCVESATAPIGGAEAARAYQHVSRIGLHDGPEEDVRQRSGEDIREIA